VGGSHLGVVVKCRISSLLQGSFAKETYNGCVFVFVGGSHVGVVVERRISSLLQGSFAKETYNGCVFVCVGGSHVGVVVVCRYWYIDRSFFVDTWFLFLTHLRSMVLLSDMGWLRLVVSIKFQTSFAEYSLFYRALLKK